jgi:hypothetical protein
VATKLITTCFEVEVTNLLQDFEQIDKQPWIPISSIMREPLPRHVLPVDARQADLVS